MEHSMLKSPGETLAGRAFRAGAPEEVVSTRVSTKGRLRDEGASSGLRRQSLTMKEQAGSWS